MPSFSWENYIENSVNEIERGDGDKAERLTRDAAKWILVFVIPVTLAFFLFPERIVSTLYRRGLAVPPYISMFMTSAESII